MSSTNENSQNPSANINDVISRLNSSTLEPDRDLDYNKDGETNSNEDNAFKDENSSPESNSLARTPSTTSSQKELVHQEIPNGDKREQKSSTNTEKVQKPGNCNKAEKSNSQKSNNNSGGIMSKVKNPLSLFKKKSDKDKAREEKAAKFERMLSAVHIDTLPQLFVTKYIGFQLTKGLYGAKYTRDAAENLISQVAEQEKQKCLPLMQLHVSVRGIYVSEHKENTAKEHVGEVGLLPLEFISYGVQDVRYTRVFTFIIVREMSSKQKKLECHAYLCDSSTSCRKLALSVALAFQEYVKTLEGKPHKFQVDLRNMKEIDQELMTETSNSSNDTKSSAGKYDEECEA